MKFNRNAFVAILIVVLVGVSSSRLLDDYVDDYTTGAIKNAAITYATARGINALVSMMQSSEVEAGIGVVSGSVTIGELLDPLNDMIERFSTAPGIVRCAHRWPAAADRETGNRPRC